MILTQNADAISYGIKTYFLASGGTAPYTYSVLAGGSGGSINPSTGQYTAPSIGGVDIIRATDSSIIPDHADLLISILSPLELVCEIIQREMNLADGQVTLWDQKNEIPPDSKAYISVGILSCKPFSNTNYYDGVSDVQSTNFNATISIDIFSKSMEANDRKEEIVMALNSNYSQKQQEANSFYIAKIPNAFLNVSYEQGVSMLYRFNLSVQMQYSVKKTSVPEYYDTFQTNTLLTDS